LKELAIFRYHFEPTLKQLFKHWIELELRPSSFNVNTIGQSISNEMAEFLKFAATQLLTIPNVTTANFRVYSRSVTSKVPLKFSSTFPSFQLRFEASGQMTIPCVKLSKVGVLGLNNDVAVMTNGQCGGRTMYMVRYQSNDNIVNKLNSLSITRCDSLSCVTHFDPTNCYSLQSDHLKQLAIVCPNIHTLNLQSCSDCLGNLQGLQAHCHNLQALKLFYVPFSPAVNRGKY